MMTNDMGDTEKLSQYIAEARGMGIEVLPPDLNESQVYFAPAPGTRPSSPPTASPAATAGRPSTPESSVPNNAIRFGLAAIKGVGEVAVHSILKARNEGKHFTSLSDMCQRVDGRSVNRKVLEALIKAGACDCFGKTRATLAAQAERTLARAASVIADRQRGQSSLFGSFEDQPIEGPDAGVNLPEWPDHELLASEKELLGFYVTGHPLTPYANLLQKFSLSTTKTIAQVPNRTLTRIGGMIAVVQKGTSKKTGKNYAMVTLEDLEGSVQVLCINESYDKYAGMLELKKAILVIGEVSTGDEAPKLFPQEIMRLEDAPRRYTRQVQLRLYTAHVTPESLEALRDLVMAHPGKCPLLLCFKRPTGEMIFLETHERYFVGPSHEFQQAVDERFGEDTYYAKVDNSLPERAPRRWERRSENGNEE
jgi:DNA polymerase-3 subunit alpha